MRPCPSNATVRKHADSHSMPWAASLPTLLSCTPKVRGSYSTVEVLEHLVEKSRKIFYVHTCTAQARHGALTTSLPKQHIHVGMLGAKGRRAHVNTSRANEVHVGAAHDFNREIGYFWSRHMGIEVLPLKCGRAQVCMRSGHAVSGLCIHFAEPRTHSQRVI